MQIFTKQILILLTICLIFLFKTSEAWAVNCSFGISGNSKVGISCVLANTVDGVDYDPGTGTNSAKLTVGPGASITVNDGQTLAFGVITLDKVATGSGSIIISKTGAGGQLKRLPLWIYDCNADGSPGSLTQSTNASSPGSGYRRRSLMSQISTSDTNDEIDSTYSYAWSENAGWINFRSSTSVHIPTSGELTGWLWAENVGWISLNCSNTSSCGTVSYAVTNTGGTLSGYAWSENAGWINFSTGANSVTIDGSGNFAGWAWSENLGWISFNCSNTASCAAQGGYDYKVKKAC